MDCPSDWSVGGPAIAAEFAAGAECAAAKVVDWEPPSQSGPAPSVEESIVQVCATEADARSLRQFMEDVYGVGLGGFHPVEIDGLPAFRLDQEPGTTSIFVQSASRRYQVLTSVVASAELKDLRIRQVDSMLGSISISE